MSQERLIRLLLSPLELNLGFAARYGSERELLEERSHLLHGSDNAFVISLVRLLQPQEERGEVSGIATKELVVVEVPGLLDAGGLAGIMEMVETPRAELPEHIIGHFAGLLPGGFG